MLRFLGLLCFSACAGVALATAGTCGVGLLAGTFAWCGLPFYWIAGFPLAILCALVFGLPAYAAMKRWNLKRWWQFALGGLLLAVPFWNELAMPFDSVRWAQSGLFDSLNYLGSGAVGGLVFWLLVIRNARNGKP